MIYIADYERYIFILLGASKFAYTSFLFAATTAQTTMNKAIQDMSASVQVMDISDRLLVVEQGKVAASYDRSEFKRIVR